MTHKSIRGLIIFAIVLFILGALHFLLPYGLIPKLLPFPNCGPEEWRLLGARFDSKSDVIAYLQEHELQYLTGSCLPQLADNPADQQVTRFDVDVDWQALEQEIKVEQRLGYTVYIVTYHHPACSQGQTYTFKVTSFGWASLYGCCGI